MKVKEILEKKEAQRTDSLEIAYLMISTPVIRIASLGL